MNELDLQDKYLIDFLCGRQDGLLYKEVKANTVSRQFFIVEDLKQFLILLYQIEKRDGLFCYMANK